MSSCVPVQREMECARLPFHAEPGQNDFALLYGFNPRTLQQWEQGRAKPETAVRAYLKVIERDPESVLATLRSKSAHQCRRRFASHDRNLSRHRWWTRRIPRPVRPKLLAFLLTGFDTCALAYEKKLWSTFISLAAFFALTVVPLARPGEVLSNVDWPNYGNDSGGMKYPTLTQINRDNVSKLKVAGCFTREISRMARTDASAAHRI